MNAFDILGDPVRRRLMELLADGERPAGDLAEVMAAEFGITQSAVSQHLRVLRESGFAHSIPQGARRMYSLDPTGLRQADDWLAGFRRFWEPRLGALETEIARGQRARASETPQLAAEKKHTKKIAE